jgi:tRNA(Ile2) C34 agmatinyltransferase TiaS
VPSPSDRSVILEALRDRAVRVGIVDTEFARLADASGVTVDESGGVHGADAAIAALQARCPQLFLDDAAKFNALR